MTSAASATAPLPRVTVVIPVRNEAKYIGRNLEAVLGQDYPPDRLEILVADGMSNDGTQDIVRGVAQRIAATGGATVGLVENPERIMPTGTNAAIRRATGDVIVLLGGHAQLPSNYLRTCVATLMETGADCVGGSLVSVGDGPVGETIAAAMSSPFGIGNSGFRTASTGGPIEADTVPFGAYRIAVFRRIGLFNPNMVRHQDYEFNFRLRQSGGRMLLLPAMKATYHVRGNLGALWRQYWQYGIWKGRFLRRFPQSLRVRHLVPSFFAAMLVLCAVLAPFIHILIVPLAILAFAYLGFMVAAIVSFALQGRWRVLPYLPAVMVCLQLSYGLGVWLGLAMPRVPDAPRLDAEPRPSPSA